MALLEMQMSKTVVYWEIPLLSTIFISREWAILAIPLPCSTKVLHDAINEMKTNPQVQSYKGALLLCEIYYGENDEGRCSPGARFNMTEVQKDTKDCHIKNTQDMRTKRGKVVLLVRQNFWHWTGSEPWDLTKPWGSPASVPCAWNC